MINRDEVRKKFEAGEPIRLMSGDMMIVEDSVITIGPAKMDYGRPVTIKDVENAITIYASGGAARSRSVADAFNLFMGFVTPITILGFTDESKSGDVQ
jgi:hypothetical protein